MPRHARVAPPGLAYHVIYRTAGKFVMLRREADFAAFERVLLTLCAWPVRRRVNWRELVSRHMGEEELSVVRTSEQAANAETAS